MYKLYVTYNIQIVYSIRSVYSNNTIIKSCMYHETNNSSYITYIMESLYFN